jgi:hypothetical protein
MSREEARTRAPALLARLEQVRARFRFVMKNRRGSHLPRLLEPRGLKRTRRGSHEHRVPLEWGEERVAILRKELLEVSIIATGRVARVDEQKLSRESLDAMKTSYVASILARTPSYDVFIASSDSKGAAVRRYTTMSVS